VAASGVGSAHADGKSRRRLYTQGLIEINPNTYTGRIYLEFSEKLTN